MKYKCIMYVAVQVSIKRQLCRSPVYITYIECTVDDRWGLLPHCSVLTVQGQCACNLLSPHYALTICMSIYRLPSAVQRVDDVVNFFATKKVYI